MNTYYLIPLFLSSTLSAQTLYNQLDSNGVKIGEWHSYNENQQLVIEVYNAPDAYDLSNPRFAFDLGYKSTRDTIIYQESLNYRDIKQRSDIPNLHYYKREYYIWRNTLIYGIDRKLEELDHPIFYITEPISTSISVQSVFVSYSDSLITLQSDFPSNIHLVSGETILAHDTTTVTFDLQVPEGLQRQTATLFYGDIPIEYTFDSFGYHISSEDFTSDEPLVINGRFLYYYRTSEEPELYFYDETKAKVLLKSSLAREKSIHSLSSLEPGTYWLYIKNYTRQEFLWKPLEITNN